MSLTWSLALLGLGVAIVSLLGLYAWRLRREIERRRALREEEVSRARDNCLENLDVIARAMLAEQIDLVEGCIRVSVVLDILDPALVQHDDFAVFAEVQSRTSYLHTHQARSELSPRERMREDRERLHIAALHRDRILEAAQALVAFVKYRSVRQPLGHPA